MTSRKLIYHPDVYQRWEIPGDEPHLHKHWVRSLQFSPDDEKLAFAWDEGTVSITSPSTWAQSQILVANDTYPIISLSFSYDGKLLASGGEDGTCLIWNLETGTQQTSIVCSAPITSVLMLPTGETVTASLDRAIRIWSANREPINVPTESNPMCLAFLNYNNILVWGEDNGNLCLRLNSDICKIAAHRGSLLSLSASTKGPTVVSAGLDKKAILWDVISQVPLRRLPTHPKPIHSTALSPDDSVLAVSTGYTIRLWDTTDAKEVQRLIVHPDDERGDICSLCFSHDGTLLACASWDNAVRIWKRIEV